jgi:signal transduction histidine kinase
MTEDRVLAEALKLDRSADLQTVLAAWHAATVRLERTHEALRGEVSRLTDELEVKNRELARKNRLADLGQMAAHVAHEVRNTLVPVSLYLSLLRRRVARDKASRDMLDKIAAGFAALETTVGDLLHFTSDRDPQLRTFPLGRLVEELVASLSVQLEAQTIRADIDIPPDQQITADREMIRRALVNLMLNAVDAMPHGGTLSVRSVRRAQEIELEVADTGPGLSDEALRRAFEPFYTTKPGGTGLGLAIVFRIAEVHGGTVAAANRPDGGAVFTIRLPRCGQEAAA